jgi:hypothetical protein
MPQAVGARTARPREVCFLTRGRAARAPFAEISFRVDDFLWANNMDKNWLALK